LVNNDEKRRPDAANGPRDFLKRPTRLSSSFVKIEMEGKHPRKLEFREEQTKTRSVCHKVCKAATPRFGLQHNGANREAEGLRAIPVRCTSRTSPRTFWKGGWSGAKMFYGQFQTCMKIYVPNLHLRTLPLGFTTRDGRARPRRERTHRGFGPGCGYECGRLLRTVTVNRIGK